MSEQFSFSQNPLLSNLAVSALKKNIETELKLKELGIESFDFTLGDPKEPTPQFILDALHSGIAEVSQYPSTIGNFELRKAATNWMKRRFDLNVDPHLQVISSNGSKEAVFHVPQVLINATTTKSIIVFPEPAYPIYKVGTILAGGKPYKIPLNPDYNYVLNIDDIPKNIVNQIAAIWVSYPHNPTGATLSLNEVQRIYEWALSHDIVVLSDECYIDSYLEGEEKPISFLQISKETHFKNILAFFSLSKRSGMTGFRSGLIAGDASLIQLYTKYRLNIGAGTPDFIQNAAIAAWNDDEHVKIRNMCFLEKRKLVESFLTKNRFEFLKTNCTFYMWIKVPSNYSSSNIYCEKLIECGIFVTPGHAFGESCQNYFRLALVPTIEKIHQALCIWQKMIDTN